MNEPAIHVSQARGERCARCWKVLPEVGLCVPFPDLCLRCVGVVTGEEPDMHALAAARYDRRRA